MFSYLFLYILPFHPLANQRNSSTLSQLNSVFLCSFLGSHHTNCSSTLLCSILRLFPVSLTFNSNFWLSFSFSLSRTEEETIHLFFMLFLSAFSIGVFPQIVDVYFLISLSCSSRKYWSQKRETLVRKEASYWRLCHWLLLSLNYLRQSSHLLTYCVVLYCVSSIDKFHSSLLVYVNRHSGYCVLVFVYLSQPKISPVKFHRY